MREKERKNRIYRKRLALSEFESIIKKCTEIYGNRKDIASFAQKHQLKLHASQNTNSSSSGYDIAEVGSNNPKKIYPILSIDGGGIRGIIPATILVEIEKITQKPISSLFSLIGGTSTGGILALGVAKAKDDGSGKPQYKAEDLLKIYTQEHSKVFRNNPHYAPAPKELPPIEKLKYVLYNPKYLSPLPL